LRGTGRRTGLARRNLAPDRLTGRLGTFSITSLRQISWARLRADATMA
jgi:hypothetical protein